MRRSKSAQIKIVRTKISNCNWVVVHFFDARQRNEPKKTRMGEDPHVPPVVACYTQKTLSHFLLNARGSCIAKTLLSPPQRGRRKHRGILREEHQTCRDRPHSLANDLDMSVPMRNKYRTQLLGQGPHMDSYSAWIEQKRKKSS